VWALDNYGYYPPIPLFKSEFFFGSNGLLIWILDHFYYEIWICAFLFGQVKEKIDLEIRPLKIKIQTWSKSKK